MAKIDATARVADGAVIGADAAIGPYCLIGPDVVLGDGCRLIGHVNVTGHTAIGAKTVVYPFASLGTPPQSVRYRGGPTRLLIGSECDIREGVTINIGTEDGGGLTRVGNRGFFMVGSHVGHDCDVGDNVMLANNALLGGHVTVGSYSFVGGGAAVHQFVRVGESAMISGVSGVAGDVIPFGSVIGLRATLEGLNVVGMRRRGFAREDIRQLRRAFRELFLSGGTFRERCLRVEREFADDVLVGKVVSFIRAREKRPLLQPVRTGAPAAGSQVKSDEVP